MIEYGPRASEVGREHVFGQIVLDPSPESRKPHRLGSRRRHRAIFRLASLGKTLVAALALRRVLGEACIGELVNELR